MRLIVKLLCGGFMKKKKIVLIVVGIIFAIWLVMGIIDYIRVHGFEKPMFCIATKTSDDGGSGYYVGLGYSFDIKGNFMPEDKLKGISEYSYYIFGIKVKSEYNSVVNDTIFNEYEEINDNQNSDTEDDISLSLKEGTLSSKGATFIIKNNSDKKYYYGSQYEIQERIDNKWYKIEIEGLLTWTTEAYMINPNSSNEMNIKFSYGDGELSKGKYRLVKKINKEAVNPREVSKEIYLYAEFEIQ